MGLVGWEVRSPGVGREPRLSLDEGVDVVEEVHRDPRFGVVGAARLACAAADDGGAHGSSSRVSEAR